MKQKLAVLACSFFILSILTMRYVSAFRTFRNGTRLLLPVVVEDVRENAYSSFARIRYYNFIPVEELVKEKGVIVVRRSDDGRIAFASSYDGQKLHPRELLLKYVVTSSSLFEKKKNSPHIHFASSVLRFSKKESFLPSAIRYAVVAVNDEGTAALIGLTDGDGTQLIRNLTFF